MWDAEYILVSEDPHGINKEDDAAGRTAVVQISGEGIVSQMMEQSLREGYIVRLMNIEDAALTAVEANDFPGYSSADVRPLLSFHVSQPQ